MSQFSPLSSLRLLMALYKTDVIDDASLENVCRLDGVLRQRFDKRKAS